MQILSFFEIINATLGSKQFLLIAELLSFVYKIILLGYLSFYCFRSSTSRKLSTLLIIFLVVALLNDISWILHALHQIYHFDDTRIIIFVARIGWATFITQYQALGLFLEHLIAKKVNFKKLDIISLLINFAISSCFLYSAFFKFNTSPRDPETLYFETRLMQAIYFYTLPLLIPIFYRMIKQIRLGRFPKILNQQLAIFIYYLIIPHLFLEYISNKKAALPFITKFIPFNQNALLSLSTILCSCAMYYCYKRIMRLRFLNVKRQVESNAKFNFIKDFKDVFDQLTYVTAVKELSHIVQNFFNTAFNIPAGKVRLYMRKTVSDQYDNDIMYRNIIAINNKVEHFITRYDTPSNDIARYLYQERILIKDEIEFSNFYDEHPSRTIILEFLDTINADIFLPIYEHNSFSAYIIIERNARRADKLFNNTEHDEMLVFTSYLSNVIKILKHSNLELLLQVEKELQEDLHLKHQEVSQYKESVGSFLRNHDERKVGIIFYKGRKFTFASEAAHELLGINVNDERDHPLTHLLKEIASKVREYKNTYTSFVQDSNQTKLIVSAILGIDSNTVILTVYYPEVSDIVKAQFDQLQDHSTWDYLLYLETTQSGQLINQFIPGTSQTLLNFKINILATALSKKATLLQLPEDDITPIVDILHHISTRPALHIMDLTTPEKHNEIALKLFGINPLFEDIESPPEPLLQKLDGIGTLFIQNIHFLALDTQHLLAQFITYGSYYHYKSDHRLFSNVRIICSTDNNLNTLVAEGKFSKKLFDELKKTSLSMPPFASLPDIEVTELIDGFIEQILKDQPFKNLLDLSPKDKSKLVTKRPVSLQELKTKVYQLLPQKSVKYNIHDTIELDPAYNTADPELAHAIRLGKKALKNPHAMTILWDKFKNQNKIAELLGVNRSSVNRRCQEYNLH
jgi:Sigma-54 interaction domain